MRGVANVLMGGVVLSWRTVCTGGVASAFVASGFGLSVLVGVTGTGTAVFWGAGLPAPGQQGSRSALVSVWLLATLRGR